MKITEELLERLIKDRERLLRDLDNNRNWIRQVREELERKRK